MIHEKTNKFTLVTPIGLEDLALQELMSLNKELNILKKEKGIITFESTLEKVQSLIYLIKIGTKVLIKLSDFRVRDIPKLFKKLQKVDWNQWPLAQNINLNITSKDSRLFDSRKIKKCFHDALDKYHKAQQPKKDYLENRKKFPKTTIHLRIINDHCTVSLDLSGERLDRREIKLFSSEAPIRENLAAACLKKGQDFFPESNVLLDPMCGSGTFLLEAATLNKAQRRDFLINHVSKLKASTIKEAPTAKINIFGIEKDKKTFDGLLKNISLYKKTYEDLPPIKVFNKDSLKENNLNLKRPLIISNPPYGERIKLNEDQNQYFKRLVQAYKNLYNPIGILLILPLKAKTPKIEKLSLIDELRFDNGGLPVKLLIWKSI